MHLSDYKKLSRWALISLFLWPCFTAVPTAWSLTRAVKPPPPYQIHAASLRYNRSKKQLHYQGLVRASQGQKKLRCSILLIQLDASQQHMTQLIALGTTKNRAYYHSPATSTTPKITARALKIVANTKQHTVRLIGHALLIRNDTQLKSEHIKYDMRTQHITTPASTGKHSTILIIPSTP